MNPDAQFGGAKLPMITQDTGTDLAIGSARAELNAGRLITVCSYCLPKPLKAALSILPNISHGICGTCAELEFGTE